MKAPSADDERNKSLFVKYPKMPRLSRDCIITEKIDGTNALVYVYPIRDDNKDEMPYGLGAPIAYDEDDKGHLVFAGSRTRFITPDDDNFGFAEWVYANADQLVKLGPGHHFGEWWGHGIQRGYGLAKGERRFSLFNVQRFESGQRAVNAPGQPLISQHHRFLGTELPPTCCSVVPVLYAGTFDTDIADGVVEFGLKRLGSMAAPGFMNPEGIVVWHTAANMGFKKTVKDDEKAKGAG